MLEALADVVDEAFRQDANVEHVVHRELKPPVEAATNRVELGDDTLLNLAMSQDTSFTKLVQFLPRDVPLLSAATKRRTLDHSNAVPAEFQVRCEDDPERATTDRNIKSRRRTCRRCGALSDNVWGGDIAVTFTAPLSVNAFQ